MNIPDKLQTFFFCESEHQARKELEKVFYDLTEADVLAYLADEWHLWRAELLAYMVDHEQHVETDALASRLEELLYHVDAHLSMNATAACWHNLIPNGREKLFQQLDSLPPTPRDFARTLERGFTMNPQ